MSENVKDVKHWKGTDILYIYSADISTAVRYETNSPNWSKTVLLQHKPITDFIYTEAVISCPFVFHL